MRYFKIVPLLCCVTVGILLGACSSLDFEVPSKKVDYKSAGKLPSLDVPPDLTRPTADDRYTVPDTRKGPATYSEYSLDKGGRQQAGSTASGGVLPEQNDARVERSGSQRWLVVKGDPAQVWPVVKDFWQEAGFLINVESPEAGVMETDWNEHRANINQGGTVRGLLSRVFDSISSTAERDKFRTRIERAAGTQAVSTEIYISHRGMQEVYITEGKDQTRWQPRKADPDLEAEMLRRLMMRFGIQEARAKQQIAAAAAEAPRASLATQSAGVLAVSEPFDRAWRRVGLALDRVGFTVEDRDRSKGIYFVRYIDPEADVKSGKTEEGLFSRLKFWSSKPVKKNEQYQIAVRDMDSTTQVNVLNKDGKPEQSATASRILTLLYDQLK